MKFLDGDEAYVLEAAAGKGRGETIDYIVVHRLIVRGLMVHENQPHLVMDDGTAHYYINMTASGWMLLSLYRSGIR